jgi:RND superfamily putative drug exporter
LGRARPAPPGPLREQRVEGACHEVVKAAWRGPVWAAFADDLSLPGTSAQIGADLLAEHADAGAGSASLIVFQVASGSLADHRAAIKETVERLGALDHVEGVADPFSAPGAVAEDGRTGLVAVTFAADPVGYGTDYLGRVDEAVDAARTAGVAVDYGSRLGQLARPSANDALSEVIGGAVALLLLLLTLGSVAAG